MADETASRTSLATKRARVLGGTYRTFYSEPLVVASASGCTITDVDGHDFLDAYNNVPVIGHSNPDVRRAVDSQLGRANVHTRYLDELAVDYAERLVAQFPDALESVVFACSGSEANDLALRLAAHATGRYGVIVTRHAYHGTTSTVAGISPSLVGSGVDDRVEPVDLPEWDDPDFDETLALAIDEAAEHLRERGHELGSFILDSAVTSDGILAPRPLSATAAAVRSHGGVWIADEVQSGFGRTGAAWGFEHLGVIPDLVTLGKPMGNGLPISAVIGPRQIFEDFGAEQRYFNTFAGTAVPIAAAEVVLTALESGELTGRAVDGGALLEGLIMEAIAATGTPATIRRSGLMVGIDFATAGVPIGIASVRAKTMVEHLYAEQLLVSTTGRASTVLKIRPPLVITDDELHALAGGFARALARLDAANGAE